MVDVIISVAAKVAELLVVPIGKHIIYPFKYKSNMEELTKQVEKLTNRRNTVQHYVDEAKRQGDEIKSHVEKWMHSVDEFTNGVVKPIIDDQVKAGKLCSFGFCPNLMARYSLSRKAAKTTEKGVDLLGEGNFDKVSYRPPLQKTTSIYNRDYEDFDSRMPVFNDLMETLRKADVNLIGVYGMGGVGKTTLVKRVVGQAIQDKLFDDVVMAEVTETPDIKNIQGQIADKLGLTFQEESLSGRADRLRDRLKKEKRVLVVLDNIWAKLDLEAVGIPLSEEEEKRSSLQEDRLLDLEAVGIPLGEEDKRTALQEEDSKGRNGEQRQCKILFTSRNLHVLRDDMNTQKNFSVEILSMEEAKILFWKIAGHSEEKPDFDTVAIEIVSYCAGLPIAIATIASALKKKSLFDWKDALDQLRKSNPRHITGMNAKVYSTIKLSYDFLESDEAKSLFLLCSLYNASSNIDLNYLLRYCIGFGLFQDVSTLEQGRNRFHKLINDLKASCLLLEGTTNKRVKMHDIIHVVAISIASTDKLMFDIQDVTDLKEMLEEKLPKDSTAISLCYKDVSMLPKRLEYPKLKLLFLFMREFSLQISDAFFEEMKELKVLDMTKFHMVSLPSSLSKLTNLQTLCLDQCQLKNVAIIGELKRLEILCFWGSDIEQLPTQIGQLTRLRLLELSDCSKLKVISPNVISSLTRLEELYMGNSFNQWEVEGQSNASLSELKQLSRLTTLEIHVLDAQIMPQGLLIFEKLERYRIIVGDAWNWSNDFESSRRLKLKLISSNVLGNGVKMLLNRTEDLYLDELKGVKNVLYELNGEGFPQLEHLRVQNGHEIQCIVNSIQWGLCNVFPKLESLFLHNLISLEKLFNGQLTTESLSKLRILKIGKCDRLKHLFSFSMAKNLLQLEEIEVNDCKKLEEIVFYNSDKQFHQNGRVNRTEFTRLRTLRLQCLPQLTSFGLNAFTPEIGSQEILAEDELGGFMPSFSQNVLLPNLENLKLSSINIECLWLDQLPAMSSCCQTLTSLALEECSGNLKFLFSYSVVQSLVQLQKLEVRNCKSIEEIINSEELRGEGKVIKMVFPKLISLQLKGLPKLSRFGSGNSVEFLSLTQISIQDCPKLKTFFSDIKKSKEVEEMNFQDDIHLLFDEKVVLPNLASMNLSSIRIKTIWHNQLQPMSTCFQNLKEIIMDGCDTVKHGFPSSMVESLVQLEVLKISNCKLMEVVTIAEGERISNTLFTKLHRLHLKHLPELTTFCNFAGKLIELTSLAELWLENCPKMHAFVSNSPRADMPAAKEEQMNSEKNLQYSHIQPFFDEKVRIIDLKSLHIEKMDNMRKIWCRQLMMGFFSKIDSFEVYDCHNLLNIFPSNMLRRLQKLEYLIIRRCNSLEVIFEKLNTIEEDVETVPRFVFPQLTCLLLSDLPSLRSSYPGLYISEWPKLNKLRMWRCNKVEILTSEFSSFEKIHGGSQPENSIQEQLFIVDKVAFPKIEHLALEWNWIVKEILHRNFSKYSCNLKVVELISASKQSGICPCCFLCTLTNLERLDVYYGFFEEIFTHEELDCKKKHAETPSKLSQLKLFNLADSLLQWEEDSLPCKVFRNLTSLEVLECDNLKNLVPSFVSFQNLKKLEVSHCHGLVNLMEVSVAKSLVQLIGLKISECKMIEEIIMHGVDEVENRMIFDQLKYLELHSLPKLTSFCSGNCNIEFPSLQQIVVRQCPTMENFSQGVLSTPKLQRIQTAEVDDEGSWEGGLNTTIQKLFKDMIGFRGLQHLTTSEFPHLKEVWHGQFPVQVFCNLKSLVMDDCANISSAISGNLLQHLNSLEKLHVRNGDSLEEVFDLEELNADGDLKVLSQLSEFFLADLPRLEHIWKKNHSEVLGFRNLKLMKVYNCSSLRYIFTPSVVLGLMQLQKLEIKNCVILEVITVIGEETISNTMFPNLKSLELINLPNLTCFCNFAGNSIELPSLTQLSIENCPNMETFISNFLGVDMSTSKDNCHTDIQPLFDEKVGLPNLEFLKLDKMDKLRKIWHHQLSSDSFCKLDYFGVHNCHNVLNVIPSNMLGRLQKLDELRLINCSSLCEIFELQASSCGKTQAITATQLEKLVLNDLPKLKHIWDVDSQGLLTCRNLISIEVTGCGSLKSIFPASVGRNLLQLEKLWIDNCCMVEEIFAKEEQVDEAVPRFSQLTILRLAELPRLRSFYPRVHVSEWPMLKKLQVWNCDKVEVSASNFLRFQVTHEMPLDQPLLLLDKVPLTNLESLGLDWNLFEKEALHEKLPEYSCKLNFLTIKGFHKGADICVFCFLHKLPNLETLQVPGGFFKGLFLCEGFGCEEKHVEAPKKLSHLRLFELNDSLHLWEENSLSSKGFQNLAILEVLRCSNIKSLVPSSVFFQNLTRLEVLECNEMLNLVAVPTAKSLMQLTKLRISGCKMVEEIIIHEGDEVKDRIIFKKLRNLELKCLPSLSSFYPGSYTTVFPSLQQVVVSECPNMKIFSRGVLSTPKLHKLQTTKAEGKGFWKGNLNTTIEHLFIESSKEN